MLSFLIDLTDLRGTRLEIAHTHIWRLCSRTRISYSAALTGTTGALSPNGNRMKLIKAGSRQEIRGLAVCCIGQKATGVSRVPQSTCCFQSRS
jgi:hypothetical protein